MNNENAAILIFACDRYELLFRGFNYFFKKYWGHTIALKKYFATEKIDIEERKGYINVKSGFGAWTNRLKRVLDQIEEDYIIFMQEDMWFSKKVPEGVLEQILSHAEKHNLKLIKLHSSEIYETEELAVDFSGFKLSKVDKKESGFLMSHQISIWNKKFLYAQLKDNEHPWRNERRGSKRLKKKETPVYQVDLLSENGKKQINNNDPGINPGEYQTVSLNACLQPKTEMFTAELETVFPGYTKELIYRMENNLTHDGKPKPRKEDLFKKIKEKIKDKIQHRQ